MKRGLILQYPEPGWASEVIGQLYPGAYVAVFGGYRTAVEAEDAGFTVRDCILSLGESRHRIWLFRKPIEEKTVAMQLLKTGSGCIWIDGCRVRFRGEGDKASALPGSMPRANRQGPFKTRDRTSENPEDYQNSGGRWPANFLLVHLPGCQLAGGTRIKGHTGYPNGPKGKSHHYSSSKRGIEVRPNAWVGHADAEGKETIAVWDCAPGCFVKALDDQSGELSVSGWAAAGKMLSASSAGYGGGWGTGSPRSLPNDRGGASRFFPQFANEAELNEWLTRLVQGKV